MANSNLRIYTASSSTLWELIPSKLFVVDDIEDYLATKTYNSILSFQYIKPQLEISITLDLSQTYAEPLSASYKYVRIENSDDTGHYYYYFVKNVVWRSKSSVRFDLLMDVLNTFKENTHYKFKSNTRIIREHKDRFVQKNCQFVFNDLIYITSVGGISINDTVYITSDIASGAPVLTGKLTAMTASSFTIVDAEGNTSKNDLQDFINASIALSKPIYLKYNDENYYLYAPTLTFTYSCDYFRNIDYINENINPLLQCQSAEGEKLQNSKTTLRGDWYLLYRNQQNPTTDSLINPVDCFLIPEENKAVLTGLITSGQITAGTLQSNKYYYVNITGSQTLTLSNGVTLDNTAIWASQAKQYAFFYKDENGLIHVDFNGVNVSNQRVGVNSYAIKYITLNQLPTTYCVYNTQQNNLVGLYDDFANDYEEWDTDSVTQYIYGVDSLDRTQAKNIKLIKIPYCPYDFTITSSKIDLTNGEWNYETIENDMPALKLNDLNTDLHSTFTLNNSSINPLFNLKMDSFTPNVTDVRRSDYYESKLYNSEFYKGTYVYDSFTYIVQLEKLNINSYLSSRDLTIYFDMTKTINSRFMFTFDSLEFKQAVESYAKYLPIARNNEEVLYNVPYINYIRTGFNYDVKNKNLSNASNWIGTGLSLAGVGLSLAMPTSSLKALGVATSLISMAMTTKNAIVSTIQNEENLQRKLTEAKNQTASVAGSDDVDLMSIYAENRLKYLVYEPNDIMKKMLFDLFYYAGYASNRLAIPNHNTRVNFDYLEADISIENVANIPDDCLEELTNAFKNGVTYIHKTTRPSNKWDFMQNYENWEKSLF